MTRQSDFKDEIIKIAREAAKKRHGGYAIYDDYNEFMKRIICQEGLLKPTDGGRFQQEIRRSLFAERWTSEDGNQGYGHRETRFYPPTTTI